MDIAYEVVQDRCNAITNKPVVSQLLKSLAWQLQNPLFNVDCISKNQLLSKEWLVLELNKVVSDLGVVVLCGGWYGTLATLLFEHGFTISRVINVDLDPACLPISESINLPWVQNHLQFKTITANITDISYPLNFTVYRDKKPTLYFTDMPDTIINTSCEHISGFDEWYRAIPPGKLVIVQSTNNSDVLDHVNCVRSGIEFEIQTPMSTVLYMGEMAVGNYTRFMRIGYI